MQIKLNVINTIDEKLIFIIIFTLATIAYILGLTVDVLDVDAAQYAAISREMLASSNFLSVLSRGENYLDKPPLLFWLSSLSYYIFGISNVSYKLPTLLVTILGVYSTYRFAKIFYGKKIALYSGTILYTCIAYFQFNQDVRTDALMTGFVIFSIWQITEYFVHNKTINFMFCFAGIGLAMLAKGPIGLMIPMLAIGTEIILRRNFQLIFKLKWIWGLLIILIVLSPMLYGLYVQYGFIGIKFFFWTQSFGRITGENVWRDDSSYFFFLHTFLWAFLPWSFLSIFGLWDKLKLLIKNHFNPEKVKEIIMLAGFILPFIALSTSKYKLPHYIFVLMPMISVLTALIIPKIASSRKLFKIYFPIQIFVCLMLWSLGLICIIWFFPTNNLFIWIITGILILINILFLVSSINKELTILIPSLIACIGLHILMNGYVYKELTQYQSGTKAAQIIRINNVENKNFYSYNTCPHTLEFYSQMIPALVQNDSSLKQVLTHNNIWIYTTQEGLKAIRKHRTTNKIYEFDHFHITMLDIEFLNPSTRNNLIEKHYLVYIK